MSLLSLWLGRFRADSRSGADPSLPTTPAFDPESTARAYHDSREHVEHELRRIDQLVRAQTMRWLILLGEHKDPKSWGMPTIGPEEIKAFLKSSFSLPAFRPTARVGQGEAAKLVEHYVATADQMRRTIDACCRQTSNSDALRLVRLERTCNLGPLERDALLVCLLCELDPRYRRLFAYLQDDATKTTPSVELLTQILRPLTADVAALRALFEPRSPLIKYHLLVVGGHAQDEEALTSRPVWIDARAVSYLLDDEVLDARLTGHATRYRVQPRPVDDPWEYVNVDEDHRRRLRELADWLKKRQEEEKPGAVLLFHGPRGGAQFRAARVMSAELGVDLLYVDVAAALRSPVEWNRLFNVALREALWLGAAVYWAGAEQLRDRERSDDRWNALMAAAEVYPGVTFVASEATWYPSAQFQATPFLHVEFPTPAFTDRLYLWEKHLPPDEDFSEPPRSRYGLVEELANGFQLTEGQILDAVAGARWLAVTRCPVDPRITPDLLFEACRRQSGQRLSSFARRIEPRRGLDFPSLIVPEAVAQQIRELWHRIHLRGRLYSGMGLERRVTLGRGTVALFVGPSGTGKTMAAELLANKEKVDLYKVDLAAVVSKWVGETEKNLAAVFAEAQDANAVILFDEADALFSKRGEVKDAQDRWANLEANFLLQRIEEYTGAVILTSNLKQNIDDAFLRRIHVSIDFPFPDADARFKIWNGLFPSGMGHPCAKTIMELANRFELSGGNIRNVVIDASFRALAEADPQLAGETADARCHEPPEITPRDLILSVAREYQKLGRPITRTEFSGEYYKWIAEGIFMRPPDQ